MTGSGAASRPSDEAARMAEVRRFDVLDTPPDGAFDRITAMAARVCEVPISTITIVDVDRIWFRSTHGIEVDEIGRDPGLCASAVFHPGPHVVGDAASDPRTLENPLVRGELGLRFYAGIPLTTGDGHRLGTLNVIDTRPRELRADQLQTLEDLAAVVMDELELRRAARRTIELEASREAAIFRDQLMSGITHEMRTPLAVLHGIAAMDEHWAPGSGEQMRDVMRRHVRQLDWLVTQFLEYARLEDGRLPAVRLEPVDVRPCVEEAIEVFAARGPLDVRVGELPQVRADKHRVVQILVELLSTALRAGPPDEPVRVEAGIDPGGDVSVTVTEPRRDRPGPDVAAMLDTPGHASGAGRRGIGLFVARALAEAQHGRLGVAHPPDGTTRLELTLPIAR